MVITFWALTASAQQGGSIRGIVYDKDFDAPLAAAQVLIVETGAKVLTSDEGNFLLSDVPSGPYTLVFSKEGYTRTLENNVMVSAGQMRELSVYLSGEFTDMEEFVVQDLQISGSEAGLLMLRVESPSLLDSISSELLSKAGASDAASALKLVSGATVQDGKYAVIRGLPDRYVNSQMNSVRLPSADADKRAVQLDQFPSEMIESVQVSKTFTPDQQGDASGGAVNVKLKSIPDEKVLKVKAGTSYNSQNPGKDFLTYSGGGTTFWGDRKGRDIPSDGNFTGTVGVSRGDAPVNFNGAISAGGKQDVTDLVTVGGFVSVYHKHDSSFHDNGVDDSYWVADPGLPLTPRDEQGTISSGTFKTSLFDITKGTQEVQRGGLFAVGTEIAEQSVDFIYMATLVAEDTATLSEDRRGKEYFFPGYDPNDPLHPGNLNTDAAPYVRTETLEYTERSTNTMQINGDHKIPTPEFGVSGLFMVLPPEIDWTLAQSTSELDQPDKRQFGSVLYPTLNLQLQYQPSADFTLGNLQRIWKDISEESDQYFTNFKLPFEQWSGDKGYIKIGVFRDEVKRQYNQDSFSNFTDPINSFSGGIEDFWSAAFPGEGHIITAGDIDVDYEGNQEISAKYVMGEIPLLPFFKVIGGVRYEETQLSIANTAEPGVTWVPPGSNLDVTLNPGDADVSFSQKDVLPVYGFVFNPLKQITLRGSYAETVARQTFKELSPIKQQEYLGADVFLGNPDLTMSALKNYDMRLEYVPYEGGLLSYSWFYKKILRPIEYVQDRAGGYGYTTAVNYPSGILQGSEFELKQSMDRLWDPLEGLSVGGNLTFIKSKVNLTQDEIDDFNEPFIMVPMTSRDMSNAPEYLYNAFLTYDWNKLAMDFGVFYTVKGDTLIAGAGQSNGNFIPSLYEKESGTLNVSVGKKLGEHGKVAFQVKNLLNPAIQTVYRSYVLNDDKVKTSFKRGVDYSLSVNFNW